MLRTVAPALASSRPRRSCPCFPPSPARRSSAVALAPASPPSPALARSTLQIGRETSAGARHSPPLPRPFPSPVTDHSSGPFSTLQNRPLLELEPHFPLPARPTTPSFALEIVQKRNSRGLDPLSPAPSAHPWPPTLLRLRANKMPARSRHVYSLDNRGVPKPNTLNWRGFPPCIPQSSGYVSNLNY